MFLSPNQGICEAPRTPDGLWNSNSGNMRRRSALARCCHQFNCQYQNGTFQATESKSAWEYFHILFLKVGGFASKAAHTIWCNQLSKFQSAQGWVFVQDRGPKLGMFHSHPSTVSGSEPVCDSVSPAWVASPLSSSLQEMGVPK